MHKPTKVNDPRTNTGSQYTYGSPNEATERMRAVSAQVVCHEIEVCYPIETRPLARDQQGTSSHCIDHIVLIKPSTVLKWYPIQPS